MLVELILNKVSSLKKRMAIHKINSFFFNIEDIVQKYLKIYIIKPNSLVESNDKGFKNIELYNLKNSVLNGMDFEERLSFYKRIKSQHINANNCLYFSYNENNDQPLIFTIWSLGEEIRIGCFIYKSMNNIVFNNVKDRVTKNFNLFRTTLFEVKSNEIERNDYLLTEIILTNNKLKSMYNSIENQIFIAQIFAVVITQTMLEYIESSNKEKN